MGEQGLRVLAFAARVVADGEQADHGERPDGPDEGPVLRGDGRASSTRCGPRPRGRCTTALGAGIDVRMITGDHAVTAPAIGRTLGLGPGAISGAELQALSDDELRAPAARAARVRAGDARGQAAPGPRRCSSAGLIVAMTGDAVNDAAALKQADIGVAMGSGSEVTKQAGRMILTDDNFGTLVHAVEIGRRVYEKIVSYVRFQMTQLLGLVLLFVVASAFNINSGVALTPSMVLYLLFFVTAAGVVVIAVDPGDPDVMHRPPRDPKVPITNRTAVLMPGCSTATVLFVAALIPLVAGPDTPHPNQAQRVPDHDLRRHGTRHGVQRADQPARPGERSRRRRSQGGRHLCRPRRHARAGHAAADPAERAADPVAHRPPVAGLHRPGPPRCPS